MHSPTKRSWYAMISRCRSPKDAKYYRYGLRGIVVCDRWMESFDNFLADMGERPEGTSIDRIDNDGNYEPSNCRWATPLQQAENRGGRWANKKIEINGRSQLLSRWCEEYGKPIHVMLQRLRRGMDVLEALEAPRMKPGPKKGTVSSRKSDLK